MKKLWIVLCLILLSSNAYALGAGMAGAAGVSAAASPCPSGTNYLSAWNGDHTSGTGYMCYNSKASAKNATTNGTVEVTADYGETGIGLQITAANEGLEWAISSQDIINETVGTLCVSIYVDAAEITGVVSFIDTSDDTDTNDGISCWVQATDSVRCSYMGNTAQQTATSGTNVTVQTWTLVKYSWDETNNLHGVCLSNCDITAIDEAEELATMTTVPTVLVLGENKGAGGAVSHTVRIDNLRIYSTYNASCE